MTDPDSVFQGFTIVEERNGITEFMNSTRQVLEKVRNGSMSVEEAELFFKKKPFTELGFAKLDSHREIRNGFPEVVFCENKPDEYLVKVFKNLYEEDGRVFGTRATKEQYELVRREIPEVSYDPVSRILKVFPSDKEKAGRSPEEESRGYIAVCCAGTADIPVAEEAAQTAEYFGSRVERIYDVGVSGLHRLLSQMDRLLKADCIVAVAGMEGALPSVIGGIVENPVIAVPVSVGYGAGFKGLSALLTMLNSCANGIAVVNIDNGFGGGYFATQINRLACAKEERQDP